jgi:hypothetical protein
MKTHPFAAAMLVLALSACSPSATKTPMGQPDEVVLAAAAEGEMCGGIAGIACGEGFYCAADAGRCNIADGSGTCTRRPEVCTEQHDPVCGCDDRTYGNACNAAMAGVNVGSRGECPERTP